MKNAIEIKNLSKKYDDFLLDKITLSIPMGSVVGIIGENGAGKSTLINSILGILQSNYECLNIFGKKLSDYEKEIKEDIAVIFDSLHYNLEFTPHFIGYLLSKTYQNWNMDTYKWYLDYFELPEKKKLKTFSRGMKMKLEFAIAFSHGAKLLILDEATSGLDPIVRDDILSIIRKFTEKEEHTVLLSSHITSDLDKISDYIAYLHQGKLLFMKSYEELHEEYGIIHTNQNILESLNPENIVRYIKKPYNCSILVNNRQAIQKIFRDLEIMRPTVEEIMIFYAKGVN